MVRGAKVEVLLKSRALYLYSLCKKGGALEPEEEQKKLIKKIVQRKGGFSEEVEKRDNTQLNKQNKFSFLNFPENQPFPRSGNH